ncbi:MAG: hypothetical protein ACO28M_04515 [Vulcanococcus sp.]
MTTTPTNVDIAAPQITTPEGSVEGMVAPGQESLLEEFIQEQQAGQPQEQQLLAGKFKSVEELERSYQELQRKLGQPERAESDPAEASPAQGYSQEQAAQVYGSEAVEALQAKGIDLADVMFKADNGEDISNHFDDLAEVFQVPRQVVENYVGKAQASGTQQPAMSEPDAAEIKAMVGGDQGFADLSAWASANLEESELASYNAVVDSGNKAAIEWAIKAMVARRSAPDAVVEPKLYGGGNAPRQTRFESQQQVLDAMNKTNERGQRLYDVDEAYRNKVAQMMAASDVF